MRVTVEDARAPGARLSGPSETRERGWQARLEMQFALREARTVVARSVHHGPLRVQRPFYPEPNGTCHVYVLHPPGGVVGGDRLELRVSAPSSGRALITTPGATKLYRSAGEEAQLIQNFELGPQACLEWLPQDTIAFSGARASVKTCAHLRHGASYAGWDIVCLGRAAAGEAFEAGRVRIEHAVEREGKLIWIERARFTGGDRALRAPWGLAGQGVVGTFVIAPAQAPDEAWVEAVRERVFLQEPERFAITCVSGVVVARYLGPDAHEASALFRHTWHLLRPFYANVAAVAPRIWHT